MPGRVLPSQPLARAPTPPSAVLMQAPSCGLCPGSLAFMVMLRTAASAGPSGYVLLTSNNALPPLAMKAAVSFVAMPEAPKQCFS